MPNSYVEISVDISPKADRPITSYINNTEFTDNNIQIADGAQFIIEEGFENKNIPLFMTLEHNINILDGTLTEYDNNMVKYGYLSTTLSNNNCICDNVITISFSNFVGINIFGLMFSFNNKIYSAKNIISYIDNSGEYNKSFSPSYDLEREFFEGNDINTIKIYLKGTKFPRMFSRINYISFDLSYRFSNDSIVSCKLNEEFSPISQVLPVNTCEFTVYSPYNQLDIISNSGISDILRVNRTCDLGAIYNGEYIHISNFYISSVESADDNIINVKLVSIINLLDSLTYTPRCLLTGNANGLIYNILSNTSIPYAIDESFTNSSYSNIFIKRGSAKNALQSVIFMINAVAKDDNGIIKIYKQNYTITNTITGEDIIEHPKISRLIPDSNIVINTYDYSRNNGYVVDLEYTGIYNGTVPETGIQFNFDKPIETIRYQVRGKDNKIKFETEGNTSIPGAFVFSYEGSEVSWSYIFGTYASLSYNFNPQSTSIVDLAEDSFIIEITYLAEHQSSYVTGDNSNNDNIIRIDEPKIFNKSNVSAFADNIINYYRRNPVKIEFTYLWKGDIRTGDTVYIYNEFEFYFRATIIKQSIDLGNGFISKATAVGDIININEQDYMNSGSDNLGNEGQYNIIMEDNLQI